MNSNNDNSSQNVITNDANNARAIIINIDDLGLSGAVNEAVVHLAKRGLVGASSYMVGGTISDLEIRALDDLGVDVGLHLDLTGVFASGLPSSLKSLLMTSYLRRLQPAEVSDVIKRQLDQFEDTFNQDPVFIDGHQHIHQFPIIRDCLMQVISERYLPDTPIHARVTTPLINDVKSQLIYRLGGEAWHALCDSHNLSTNDYFGGVYDFEASVSTLSQLWNQWLTEAPRTKSLKAGLHTQLLPIEPLGTYAQYGSTTPPIHSVPLGLPQGVATTLIMCHPAAPNDGWQDNIKAAREREFEWLMSHQFEHLLERLHIRLIKWSDMTP